MPIEYTSLDEDLLMAGIDGYARPEKTGNFRPIYSLKKGTHVYRFVTDPWTKNEDNGWYIYREVSAWDGIRGGYQLPMGLKEFPVNDQVIVTDPETGERRRAYAPRGTDPILELVAPSSKFPPADGKVKGSDKLAVNAIDEEGRHIILKMSGSRGADLLRIFNQFKEMDPNFTATAFPWQIALTGQGFQSVLSVKPLRDEPPVELPEPFDIAEVMQGVRMDVEDFVESLRGGGSSAAKQDVVEEEHDIVDMFEEVVAKAADTQSGPERFEGMSDVRLKTLLAKAGVKIPPRTTRPALIELAAANL